MNLKDCGDMLLFLWMENILTDSEYDKSVKRFNKKIEENMKFSDGYTCGVSKLPCCGCSACCEHRLDNHSSINRIGLGENK